MYNLCEKIIVIDGKPIISYGICFNNDIFFEDISTEKCDVEKLIEIFNEENVLPVYAPELIEDFISGGCSF